MTEDSKKLEVDMLQATALADKFIGEMYEKESPTTLMMSGTLMLLYGASMIADDKEELIKMAIDVVRDLCKRTDIEPKTSSYAEA